MRQEDHPVLRAIQEIKKAVIGKDDCIVKVMTAILAGGHILIEDIPLFMRQEDHPVLRAIQEIKKAVIGKDDCIVKVMTAILAGGHILIEDIPGVGKTTMALAFSRALNLEQHRIQFTPDVLPADVTGFSLYQKETM